MCSTSSAGIENCGGLPGLVCALAGGAGPVPPGCGSAGVALAGAAAPDAAASGIAALGIVSLADFGLLRRDPPPRLPAFATFGPLAFASNPGLEIWKYLFCRRVIVVRRYRVNRSSTHGGHLNN